MGSYRFLHVHDLGFLPTLPTLSPLSAAFFLLSPPHLSRTKVDKDYLNSTLDRFANFFTNPLLTASSAYKEMHAVDSEYRNDLVVVWHTNFQLSVHVCTP